MSEEIEEIHGPEKNINPEISVFTIVSGDIFELELFKKIHDIFLILIFISSACLSIIEFLATSNICGVGYLLSGLLSIYSFRVVKKGRLNIAIKKSINVLQSENDELKENNDDLKSNIYLLESVQKNLESDIDVFKKTIGVFGSESEDILNNLKDSYNKYKIQNDRQSKISDNLVYLNILDVIKHFDENTDYHLSPDELENAKEILKNNFPNLNYEKLKKIEKVSAKTILESIEE